MKSILLKSLNSIFLKSNKEENLEMKILLILNDLGLIVSSS